MTGLQYRNEQLVNNPNVGDLVSSGTVRFSMASKEESHLHLMLITAYVVGWNYTLHVFDVGVSFSQTHMHILFVATLIISGTAERFKGQHYDRD